MYTTIKVSAELKAMLDNIKMNDGESYEDVIGDLIEDHLTLNPEFRKGIEKAKREIARGEFVTLAELKKGLKRHV
jgi:predicted transcriptional regulator